MSEKTPTSYSKFEVETTAIDEALVEMDDIFQELAETLQTQLRALQTVILRLEERLRQLKQGSVSHQALRTKTVDGESKLESYFMDVSSGEEKRQGEDETGSKRSKGCFFKKGKVEKGKENWDDDNDEEAIWG